MTTYNITDIKKAEKNAWHLLFKKFRTKRLTDTQQQTLNAAGEIVKAVSYAVYQLHNLHDTSFPSSTFNDMQLCINAPFYTVTVEGESCTFSKCDLYFYN